MSVKLGNVWSNVQYAFLVSSFPRRFAPLSPSYRSTVFLHLPIKYRAIEDRGPWSGWLKAGQSSCWQGVHWLVGVIDPPNANKPKLTLRFYFHLSANPVFTTRPKETITKVGKTVTLVCKAKGQPVPRVWWKKVPMADPKGPPWKPVNFRNGLLTFSNASKHDQGIYICYAQNSLGVILTSAKLTVLSPLKFKISPPKAVMTVLGEKLYSESRFPSTCYMGDGRPFVYAFWNNDIS